LTDPLLTVIDGNISSRWTTFLPGTLATHLPAIDKTRPDGDLALDILVGQTR
jgi:hypothetical protein